MDRPKLLDLFCKAGGAAMGYHRAGFEVVGVDIEPQKRYPFEFHMADALDYLQEHGHEFDVIHASPPCQLWSQLQSRWRFKPRCHPLMLEYTRRALAKLGKPFVLENVPRAPLENPIILCGSMFGLKCSSGAFLWRHRGFEIHCHNYFSLKMSCVHKKPVITVTGHCGGTRLRDGIKQYTADQRREAMGIDWMTAQELSQAIPPAYTEFIGKQIMRAING